MCAGAKATGATAQDVLGGIDALKLRSSMTLFARAAQETGRAEDAALFRSVLDAFYDGAEDPATLERLGDGGAATT